MKTFLKIYILCSFLALFSERTLAQPTPSIVVENISHSSGTHNYCSYGCIISPFSPSQPVSITNTAKVVYRAGSCIQLLPGFSVSSLAPSGSGGGSFNTQLVPPDFPVVVITPTTTPTTQVGVYEKLEYGLDLPTDIDALVAAYFANNTDPTAVNPFNPDDITINAYFTSPSGFSDRAIHGFYYEAFDYINLGNETQWVDQPTPYNFRVRFAPTEIGTWGCVIEVISPNGKFPSYLANCIQFNSVPSSNNGYLKVGAHKRQLKFSKNNESFFAIGQNIPWVKEPYWGTNKFNVDEFRDYYNEVENLADNSGNFFRMIMAPWSHGIEFEKLGDYGKTEWNTHPAVHSYTENRQHNAFELDKLLDLCEQRDIYMLLNLEMQTNYNVSSGIAPVYSWGNFCYNTPLSLASPSDAFVDANARIYFQRRLRYIIARWGYSTSIAAIELLSEHDKWDGYHFPGTTTVNATVATNAYTWHDAMFNYITNTLGETNHLLTTSLANRQFSSNPFSFSKNAITSGHKYGHDKDVNYTDRYKYMNENPPGSGVNGLLEDYDKPSIFGELGLEEQRTSSGALFVDAGNIEGCDDVGFHNNLWSTAFMGCYGTGLNWWQEYNDTYRADNFPALKAFFSNVDFEANNFIYPQRWRQATLPVKNYRGEVFALRNYDKKLVMGWAHSSSVWWGNIAASCVDPATGNTYPLPSDDDTYCCPTVYLGDIKITNLKMLKQYTLDWYFTENPGPFYAYSVSIISNLFGRINPPYPTLLGYDAAFKGFYDPIIEVHTPEPSVFPPDTLLCGEDTITVDGTYEDDLDGAYSYYWDFGNGQTSTLVYPTVIYSLPGTYTAMLVVTDTLGNIDTLIQPIVVPDCSEEQRISQLMYTEENTKNAEIGVFPNPNSGQFTVSLPKDYLFKLEIFDITGKLILTLRDISNETIIMLNEDRKGMYMVKATSKDFLLLKKVIIQ